MRRWTIAAGLVAAAALVTARRVLLVVRVEGASMEPTYRSGDAVLALRRGRRPVRSGDVVVCRPPAGAPRPGALLIKRVVAVAGEPMPPVNEPSALVTVPAGHVFVRGDAARSLDSRQFGPVPLDHVIGHVIASLSR